MVPIILLNKNKKESIDEDTKNKDNNNPGNNENNNEKSVDLSSIDVTAQLDNIGSNSNTLENFCNYLQGITLDDDKAKVKLIYKWVAENIEYDYVNYKANNPVDCEPANVLINKKTVCSGYARLFTRLLTCLGYPPENIKNIIGHSKGIGYDVEKQITDEDTDHEWNAVKIGEKWCLIDVTWGAGSIVNDAFEKSYTEYYLCTPPAQFVRSHLPKETEKQYQFLDNPIDISTFKNLAPTTINFFEYGFVSLVNDQAIQNICGDGKIILKYDTASRPPLLLKLKKGSTEYSKWIMEEKITNGYDINFYINEEGNYDLEINANNDGSNSYKRIVSFKIKCDTTPSTKKLFPILYSEYKNDESMKLISPIDNDLIQGEKYNFKIQTSQYDQLYLLIGKTSNNEFIAMNKEGTTFTENEVMIHGDHVKISYKNTEGSYSTLVEYSTQGAAIDFPSTSETPFKKRLESPLLSNLQKGQTYDFKIICDTTYSIKINDGNNWHELDKDGTTYTVSIPIDSSATQLLVMYGLSGGSYQSMYIFSVS